jgi:hypothetical protein
MSKLYIALVAVVAALAAVLPAQILPNFASTRIRSNRSITFRYRDPGAKAVLCLIHFAPLLFQPSSQP